MKNATLLVCFYLHSSKVSSTRASTHLNYWKLQFISANERCWLQRIPQRANGLIVGLRECNAYKRHCCCAIWKQKCSRVGLRLVWVRYGLKTDLDQDGSRTTVARLSCVRKYHYYNRICCLIGRLIVCWCREIIPRRSLVSARHMMMMWWNSFVIFTFIL